MLIPAAQPTTWKVANQRAPACMCCAGLCGTAHFCRYRYFKTCSFYSAGLLFFVIALSIPGAFGFNLLNLVVPKYLGAVEAKKTVCTQNYSIWCILTNTIMSLNLISRWKISFNSQECSDFKCILLKSDFCLCAVFLIAAFLKLGGVAKMCLEGCAGEANWGHLW